MLRCQVVGNGPPVIDQGFAADPLHFPATSLEEELAQVYSAEERAVMGREELVETEKNKDRRLIQRIPYILARVGYTVIKLGEND